MGSVRDPDDERKKRPRSARRRSGKGNVELNVEEEEGSKSALYRPLSSFYPS